MRRTAAVGLVAIALLGLGGCQRGRVGARCSTTDWGDDGGAWVLKCEKGRWRRALTKQQAAQILLALSTTTTTAPPAPVLPAAPPPAPPPPPPPPPPTTTTTTAAPTTTAPPTTTTSTTTTTTPPTTTTTTTPPTTTTTTTTTTTPPTTTTTTPPPTTTTTTTTVPGSPVGSTRSNPFPLGAIQPIGGFFDLWTHLPAVIADDQQIVSPATVAPVPDEAFVMVPHRVICYLATQSSCPTNLSLVRLTLVDGNGVEYAATARPAIPNPSSIYHWNPMAWERWLAFAVPSGMKDDVVLRASYTNQGTPLWFAIS